MTQKLNVHFVNRGYGTDEGNHNVPVVKFDVYEPTGVPMAAVKSPFGLKDNVLVAMYENNEWVCDLD
jgi:hypothetical protein